MTAEGLVAQFQARGIRLRVAGDMLQVAPRATLTEADRLAIRKHLVELKALLGREADPVVTAEYAAEYSDEKNVLTSLATDPAVAMVADIFGPGVEVVSTGQRAVWPPEGGWIPPSARTIDPYGPEAPTAPCPSCGAHDWHKPADNSGWLCGVCRPRRDHAAGPTAAQPRRQNDHEHGCR